MQLTPGLLQFLTRPGLGDFAGRVRHQALITLLKHFAPWSLHAIFDRPDLENDLISIHSSQIAALGP